MRLRILVVWLTPLLLAIPAPRASGQTVAAVPPAIRLAIGRPIPPVVTVRWQTPLSSLGGVLVTEEASPQVVALLPPLPASPSGSLVEQIQLPVAQLEAFAQAGVLRFQVVREFFAGSDEFAGVVAIELTSPLGGTFAINRVQLRFDEGSPLRLIPQDSEPHAFADVAYNGSGEIVAVWEVAEPASTSGAPVFRPLRRVRRHLGSGQRTSLPAPPLPTDQIGLYLVRLRVLEPALSFEEPLLRYYVASPEIPAEPALVRLVGPPHRSDLTSETVFRWQAVPGARAYRLELHPSEVLADAPHFRLDPEHPVARGTAFGDGDQGAVPDAEADADRPAYRTGPGPTGNVGPQTALPGSLNAPGQPYEGEVLAETEAATRSGALAHRPLTGVVVPAEELEARLTPMAQSKLEPGRRYVWIVRALGESGIPVGLSPARVIHVPD